MSLSFCLCISVCVSIHLSLQLCAFVSLCLSVPPSPSLCLCPSVSVPLSLCLSFCLYTSVSLCPSLSRSVSLSGGKLTASAKPLSAEFPSQPSLHPQVSPLRFGSPGAQNADPQRERGTDTRSPESPARRVPDPGLCASMRAHPHTPTLPPAASPMPLPWLPPRTPLV